MASIINASSSGSGGIVQTADASGVLQLQSNGTVALSISGAATTFGGNMLLETSGNPSMTVKTTGAGNNPWYRLQADTNYWDVLGVFSDANDTLRIRYNGSDKMILNNGGIVALAGGDSDATGTGVTFPATQNASTNANTLDDYEEGSWTATITTSGSSYSYSAQAGVYVKIGKLVHFSFQININTVSSNGSGTFNIGGLPFVQGTNYGRYLLQTSSVNFDGTSYEMTMYPDGGTGLNLLYSYDNAGWTVGTAANFPLSNGSILTVSGTYIASA